MVNWPLHELENAWEIVTQFDRFLLVCVHHELHAQIKTCQQTEAVEGSSDSLQTPAHFQWPEIPVFPYRVVLCTQRRQRAANPHTSRCVQNNNNNPLSIGVMGSINCSVCVCVCVCVWIFFSKTNRLDWKGEYLQDNTRPWIFCGTYSVYAGSSQLNFIDYAIIHSTLTPCTPFLWWRRFINLLSKSILHGMQGEKGDAYEPQ